MSLIELLITYFNYLIHPFRSHEILANPERYPEWPLMRLSAYESLATSWVFVMINGIMRIIVLNFVLVFFYQLVAESEIGFLGALDLGEVPGLYFIVLSSILDVIFYPLFGVFIIQFWEVVIRFFGHLNGTQGDLTAIAQDVMAVKLSSKLLKIIPFLGPSLESFAGLILMYAGLRKRLHTSIPLTICILLTPLLLTLTFVTILLLLVVVAL